MKTATILSFALAALASARPQTLSGMPPLPEGANDFLDLMTQLGGLYADGGVPLGPAPTGCADYEVEIARGTFEPGEFGLIVGDGLMNEVKKAMPDADVRGYSVQYPASLTGSDVGIKDIVDRVAEKAEECPDMKIALVGYSQGGMVVSSAIAKIPADQMKNVVALVLYGAGNGAGGGTPAGTGGAAPSDAVKGMTLANCAPADMCGTPVEGAQPMSGHITYDQGSWHKRTAQYLKEAFTSKAPGYKLELTPN